MRAALIAYLMLTTTAAYAENPPLECIDSAPAMQRVAAGARAEYEKLMTVNLSFASAYFEPKIAQQMAEHEQSRKDLLEPLRIYVAETQAVADLLSECANR